MGLILTILTFIFTRIIIPPLYDLLHAGGLVRVNYRGDKIPISLGLVIFLGIMPALLFYEFMFRTPNMFLHVLLLALTMFVGFLDDSLGNHETKGLKGHIKLLFFQRKLSTGSLKAITISLISMFFALNISENHLLIVINFGILVLTTNSFNLLDVRPGRVIKAFVLVWLLMFVFKPESRTFLGIVMAAVAAYAPLDFKAKAMLGDAGSNLLGMVIGIVLVLHLSSVTKIVSLLFLVYLHYYTEQKSLTALIDRLYFLKIIDDLGR